MTYLENTLTAILIYCGVTVWALIIWKIIKGIKK